MERKIIIDADKEQIFNQLDDLKNWKNWTSWAMKDPLVYEDESSYSVPSKGKGATFIWNSSNDEVGAGELTILESKPNEYMKNKIDFGFVQSVGEFIINDKDGGTEVVWTMSINFGFNPINKFFGLFLEDQVGPDYEIGLRRLKAFTENLPKIKKVEVNKELMEKDLWFLSIRDTVNQVEMNNIHGKILATINQYTDERGIELNTTPLVIYHFWSDTLIDIEVGIPVEDSTILGNDLIKMNKIKSTNVVTAVHYGAYDRLPETYFGINEWMRKNKVIVTGPPWESYITDPGTEPNPDKWQTAIYFPIE